MFAKVNAPISLLAEELDEYLSKGWFRMGKAIFTTNFLNFKDQFYSAVWLRSDLKNFQPDHTFKKLGKLNAGFRIQIQNFVMDSEKEELFDLYRESVPFEASESIQNLLFGNSTVINSIFQTYEVCIYDGDKLIAAGFFDLGDKAAAGISSFYHPLYKKHSLGKYLIYLKLDYCKKLGMKYFYPGYFVPGYAPFDYKLSIGTVDLSFFSFQLKDWIPIDQFAAKYNLFQVMNAKLLELRAHLVSKNIVCQLLNYEYFQANMVLELANYDLFDYPIFLYCPDINENLIRPVMVYDVQKLEYAILQCRSVWHSFEQVDKLNTYSEHLLKTHALVFASPEVEEIAEKLS